ncbi:523_t:CDS:1, partial [Dentiscutata erythropus]
VVGKFDYAIINHAKHSWLCFGDALGLRHNLKTDKRCHCMKSSAYSKPIRSDEFISPSKYYQEISREFLFSVEEYEVFKILSRNDL